MTTKKYLPLWIFTFLILLFQSCKEKAEAQSRTEKYIELIKNNPTATDKSEINDVIEGSLYRNNKYKFRIRFPENWTFRKGDSKVTVIKSVQADSGKSFLVTIMDYPNFKLKSLILNEELIEEYQNNFPDILKHQNIVPFNLEIKKGFLNNFPAVLISFNAIQRSQEVQLTYIHKQIHCITNGILYNLTISMPDVFFDDEEKNRLNHVIESFVFEKFL